MSHQLHDAVGLELARRIAGTLHLHPEWITLAKSNLDRWSRLNHDAPGLLASYDEWRDLLERPTEEISAALLDRPAKVNAFGRIRPLQASSRLPKFGS